MMLALLTFHVALDHGQWRITVGNEVFGPYPSREAALALARRAAGEAVKLGPLAASVLTRDGDEAWRPVWNSASEASPLAGPEAFASYGQRESQQHHLR
jgi:hypothetical protein